MAGDNSWREVRFGEIAAVRSGYAFKSTEWCSSGIPVVKIANVKSGRLDMAGCSYVDPEVAKNSGFMLSSGDILVGLTGYVGDSAIVRNEGPLVLNQRVGKISPRDGVDPRFVHCVLSSPEFRAAIERASHGSAQANVSPRAIEAIAVLLPPVAEQRAIAHILGTLDDKIELNRRMNETLEAMARALFKSWFVDFDPVHAKAAGRQPTGMDAETTKLFPSEFINSEMGPIPNGWHSGSIGDVIEIYDSRRVPLSSRERAQRRGKFPYYGATSVMDYVDAFLFDGRFVLVGEDGSVVTPEGFPFTQYVWGRFWVNNHAHVLSGIRNVSQEHLFLLLQQTNIAAYVTGAVQAKLSQGNMRKIPLVVAPDAVNARFGSVLDPLFARFRAMVEETRTLARLRDELLPRLLSGELSVDAAEREVEAVV